jgi:hypothetical protein
MLVRCVAVHSTVVGEGAVLKGIDVPIKSGPGRPAWGRDPSTAGDPGTGPAGVHGEQWTQSPGGRTPTGADLADHLHGTADDIRAAVCAWQKYHLRVIDPAGHRHLTLQARLAELHLCGRRIRTMRFHDHMNQSQTAAEIGLSQMHVSRLLRQTLAPATLRSGRDS